jgi:hypothetical protein
MTFNHLLKQIKSVFADSRDFLAYAKVLKGRRYVLITRYRRRLEIIENPPSLTDTPFYNKAPLNTIKTRRLAKLKTSIYARID